MKPIYYLISTCIFGLSSLNIIAQCPVGQMEVIIEIETDSYGYEGYWQLVPAGNNCDVGTIWEGGNALEVGCNGAGDQITPRETRWVP